MKRFAQRGRPNGLVQARPDFPEIAECYDSRGFRDIDDSMGEPFSSFGSTTVP